MARSLAITDFLKLKSKHPFKDLYNAGMEVTVNVAQDEGNGVRDGRKRYYTDGVTKWFNFRMPKNAMAEPEANDFPVHFDFEKHVDAIGCTGWDFTNRVSKWVGYDFDSIIGHKKSGLTTAQLDNIVTQLKDIDWITVIRSTSGNGLHVYVFLDDMPTKNHTEHAALARAILGKMSALTGHSFEADVDVHGAILWLWSRRVKATRSFELIQRGSSLPKSEIPVNWKDHVNVVKGKSRRAKLGLVPDEQASSFDLLLGQYPRVPLDEGHKALLFWLKENDCVWWWDSDMYMLVTHTVHLKEAHTELNLRGVFDTNSSQSTDQNCFAFPLRNGAWVVRRHGQNVKEHSSWDTDTSGWTRAYFNKEATLETAARVRGGLEHPKGGFFFNTAEALLNAADDIKMPFDIPSKQSQKEARVFTNKDNKVIVEIPKLSGEGQADMPGWIVDRNKYVKVIGVLKSDKVHDEEIVVSYDDFIRHIVSIDYKDAGWVVNLDGYWRVEPLTHARMLLDSKGLNTNDVKEVLGQCVGNAWQLVNKPFQPEYPGARQWNKEGAKLLYEVDRTKSDLNYPTWQKILDHCGKGLDDAVKVNDWCVENNIVTGGDYLKAWAASMFQHPDRPLPYLFFFGEQGTGKSTFHESLQMLFSRGYALAKQALVSQQGFNGELANAVLCAVEEVDLSIASSTAYNRIKEWVTNKQILIHPKGEQPYMIENTTHWIQCGNDPAFCPVFPDDTRIVVVESYPLNPTQMIPRYELVLMLEKEASDFLSSLFQMKLPKTRDRLTIPVLTTDSKEAMQEQSKNPLEAFLTHQCVESHGNMVKFSEFYNEFCKTVDPIEQSYWTKIRVSKKMPPKYPIGSSPSHANQRFIGNLAFKDSQVIPKTTKYRVVNSNLIEVPNG